MTFTAVDWIILIILGISAMLGFWRGFLREVCALGLWLGSFWLAFHFSTPLAQALTDWISQDFARLGTAFVGILVGSLIVGNLLLLAFHQAMKAGGLSGTDRLLGLMFGALRGGLLVFLLFLFAGLTPVPQTASYTASLLVPALEQGRAWAGERYGTQFADWVQHGTQTLMQTGVVPGADETEIEKG